jgi:hypothetical protein
MILLILHDKNRYQPERRESPMTQSQDPYQAAYPKADRGQVYPIQLEAGDPIHLTIANLSQTLCNRVIVSTATPVAAFGPRDCDTCRRMATVRHMTIISPPARSAKPASTLA